MRQLPISEAWNDAVAFVGREGGLLFPVAFALIALPGVILQFLMPEVAPGTQPQMGPWVWLMLPLAALTLLGTLTLSIMALRGGLSVGEAIGQAARRLPALIGAALLLVLAGAALLVPVAVIGALLGGNASAATALVTFALLLLVIFVGVRLVFLNPVAAIEPIGPVAILRRAWSLTGGHFWKLFAFFVLLLLVTLVVTLAVGAVVGVVLALTLGPPSESDLSKLLGLIVAGFVNTAVSVYTITVIAKLYARLAG